MAPLISLIYIGVLAGLLFCSISALFVGHRPLLLALSVLALVVFACLLLVGLNSLDRDRHELAEHQPAAGEQGPDLKLEELRDIVAFSEEISVTFAICGLVSLAGLVSQILRRARGRGAPIANP